MATARPLLSPEPPQEPTPQRHARWGRILGWVAGSLLLLLLLVTATVAFLLNSVRFHDWVLAKIESSASDSLGVKVGLQNYALHLSNLSVDLYGLTVAGANPYPNPPVLQLQHAEVGVRIVSILHQKWYLDTFRLDHPVVQVFVDKNGNSNLPKPKSSGKKSNTSIFDLGVRHAVLDQGAIFYNNRPAQLDADVKNLDLHASFNEAATLYSGVLQYTNGRVLFGTYQPFEHNFFAQFDYSPTTFQIHRATLQSDAATVNLAATVTNLDAPVVQAQYQVDVNGAQVAKLINNPSVPSGNIRATGTAHYATVANQPALNSVTVHGDLISHELLVKTPSLRAAITNIAAHYSLANGDATLHDFRASVLGGEITAQGTMKQISGNSHSDFSASVRNISLAEATRLAATKSSPPVAVTGTLNAEAKATWGKTLNDLVAHADASLHGQASGIHKGPSVVQVGANGSIPSAPATVPIDSEIHAIYNGARQEIALNQSYVHLPSTNLTMNGTLSQHSSLAIHLQANDLNQLATIANIFRTPAPGQAPLDLAGQASFQGTVQGSTSAPHLAGQLSATNLHFNDTDWKVFRTNVDASPSQASLTNADLEPKTQGRITLSATTGLKKWAFTNTSPLQVSLNASQLNIADLTKLSGKQIPVTGTLNTHVTLHGTELNPIGNGNLSLTKVDAYNEPISAINITFAGTGDNAHADLSVQMPAGSVQGNVDVQPKQKTYTAKLNTSGIDIAKLQTVKAKNLGATGVVMLNATGQGTFDNPQVKATIQIPTLTVQKQTIKAINLNLDMANHVANANLVSTAVNTSIQAKARVNLTGDYETDAAVDTQNIALQPIVAMYSPAQAAQLSGATELHATVHGPLKNQNALQAHVTIPYLKVGYGNSIQLAAAGPIQADYKNGVVELQHGAIRGTDTDIDFQGSIPVVNRAAPMSLLLHGTLDLKIAQLFDPDVRTSGQVRFNINSTGTTAGNLGGEIDVVDANYASPDLPVGLQHGNGVLTLTTDRLNISHFDGMVGGGKVTASGGVAYRPNLQFNLGLAAQGIRLLYPDGMRESVDANIRLAGTTDNAQLGGTVNLTDLSFTPAFDLTSFLSQFSGGVAGPPSQGIAQNINLNLAVNSTNNINLVSRTLSVNGSANLQVRGTAADPVILGRVNLNSGDVILNNTRFVLAGGTVQFVNPSQTQPVVNVTVTTTIQQYNLSMRFQGPADQLRTQYSSDPALPQADIINLLAFGETTEASANSPATPATQQAESLVASQVTSQLTSRLSKVAGISQLSISPVLGNSNNQSAGANITVQQRVTGNLFITYSTNTADTQSQVIQGQYQVSPRVSLSATRDPNGGFAVDTLIKKTW